MPWPAVLSEEQTLDLVLAGRSLARYGDGEFNLCCGFGIKSQRYDPVLAEKLKRILLESGDCLVGIPNLLQPTKPFWDKYRGPQTTGLLRMSRTYASAFVSRPDSAPWIATPRYWRKVEQLWKGQHVTLVRGSEKSLTAAMLSPSAASVKEIVCAKQDAWGSRAQLLEQIGRASRVLLCCGPTATVLAVKLASKGIQAIDLGHIGMWLKRQGKPVETALAEGRRER